jgi:hypothetical protein
VEASIGTSKTSKLTCSKMQRPNKPRLIHRLKSKKCNSKWLRCKHNKCRPQFPPAAQAPGNDLIFEIEQLAQLKNAGVLTAEEFQAAKAKLLSA